MQLTMLKVMALSVFIGNISFPWWLWLWGIVSEINGILYFSVDFTNCINVAKSLKQPEE